MKNLAPALLLVFLIACFYTPAQAEQEMKAEKKRFVYSSEGRRDPFLSIIAAAKKTEERKRPKGLVPLEDYDISQIKVVAIIWTEEMNRALVGLPDGKYYTIKEGTTLGLHGGKVRHVTRESVVVREYIRDYRGKLRPQDTVLKLRKGEEE